MPRMSIRPSKAGSAVGVIVALGMLVFFLVVLIPAAFQGANEFPQGTPGVNQGGSNAIGIFAALFVMLLVVGGGFYAYNLLGGRGAGLYDVDVDPGEGNSGEAPGGAGSAGGSNDFEAKLRKLNKLRIDGLLSEEEYQAKRAEIMSEQW